MDSDTATSRYSASSGSILPTTGLTRASFAAVTLRVWMLFMPVRDLTQASSAWLSAFRGGLEFRQAEVAPAETMCGGRRIGEAKMT